MINSSGATPTSSRNNNNPMISPSARRNISPTNLAKISASNNNTNNISSSEYESIRERYINSNSNNNTNGIPNSTSAV